MVRMRGVCAACLILLGLFHGALSRPRTDEDETNQVGQRHRRQATYGWKHTKYLIESLRQHLNNNDLYFCDGDPFKGIQCPEEPICVDYHQICDGVQSCGLEVREACINSTIYSYGRTDDRFCVGDENPKWCNWKRSAPTRCGEDFVIIPGKKRQRFRIKSPGYPSNYPADRYCYWTVRTIPGRTLSVKFLRFATEPNYDYISLGQGLHRDDDRTVLLYRHNGRSPPADFKTNRALPYYNQLWISFRSDDWDTDKGFNIEVSDETFYDAPIVASNPLRAPPRRCGAREAIPIDEELTITSPGYPNFYATHVRCEWIISARRGRRIEVRFGLFDVEEDVDFVSLGNGPTPRRYPIFYRKTGTIRDYNGLRHISTGSDVWLIFESSVAIARQGFYATFREIPIADCGGALVVPNNGSLSIASPNYPSVAYRSNLDCTWWIRNDEGRRMWISFYDFSTEWQKDFLSVGNGAPLDRNRTTAVIILHSGAHMPDPYDFMSTGDEVWMHFTTSGYNNYRGFRVDIFDELLHPAPITTMEPTTPTPPTTEPSSVEEGGRRTKRPYRPRPNRKPKPKPRPVLLPGMQIAPTGDVPEWTPPSTTTRPPTTTKRTTTRRTTTTKRPTTTRRTTTTRRPTTTTRRPTTTTRRPTTTRRTTTTRRPTTTTIRTTTRSRVPINPWTIPSESSSSSSYQSSFSTSSSSASQFV